MIVEEGTSEGHTSGGSRIAPYSRFVTHSPSESVYDMPSETKLLDPKKGALSSPALSSPTSPRQKVSSPTPKSVWPPHIMSIPSKAEDSTKHTSGLMRKSSIPSRPKSSLQRSYSFNDRHSRAVPVLPPALTNSRPSMGLAARRGSTTEQKVSKDDRPPPRPPRRSSSFNTKKLLGNGTQDPRSFHVPKRTTSLSPPHHLTSPSPPPFPKEGYTLLSIPEKEVSGIVSPRVLSYQSQQAPTLASGNTIRMGFGNPQDFQQDDMDCPPFPVHDYEGFEEFNFDREKVEENTELTSSGYTSGGDIQSSRQSDTDESFSDYGMMSHQVVFPDTLRLNNIAFLLEMTDSPPPLQTPRVDQAASLEHIQVRYKENIYVQIQNHLMLCARICSLWNHDIMGESLWICHDIWWEYNQIACLAICYQQVSESARYCNLKNTSMRKTTLIARFMGPTWGPTGPRWDPCWPHELCYQGTSCSSTVGFSLTNTPWWMLLATFDQSQWSVTVMYRDFGSILTPTRTEQH